MNYSLHTKNTSHNLISNKSKVINPQIGAYTLKSVIPKGGLIMSKISEKQLILIFGLLFIATYIIIHTDALEGFFTTIRPFINGFVLAYLTDLIATKIEKKINLKRSRAISIILVYLLIFSTIAISLLYVIPILISNVQLLIKKMPEYLSHNDLPLLNNIIETFSLRSVTLGQLTGLMNFTIYARQATGTIINAILSFVVSVYVLLTKTSILQFMSKITELIFPNHNKFIRTKFLRSHIVFQQFLLAQVTASLILGFASTTVLSLLGVNYAILIGAIIGFLNIIPLVGAIIGVIISTTILYLTNSVMLASASFAFLLLLQQVDATIVTPKLMGNAVNLNPIVVILVLALGTNYFGIIGILFAIPITVLLRELLFDKMG